MMIKPVELSHTQNSRFKAVFRIRIALNTDLGTAFHFNTDKDPVPDSRAGSGYGFLSRIWILDPDSGSTFSLPVRYQIEIIKLDIMFFTFSFFTDCF